MFTTIFGDDNTSLGKNTRITLNHSILDKGIRTSSKHLENPGNSTSGYPKSNSLAHYLSPWNYVVSGTGCGSNKEWSVYTLYVEGGILSLWPISKKWVGVVSNQSGGIQNHLPEITFHQHQNRRISAELFDQASGMRFRISFIQKSCCTSKSYTFGRSLTFQKIAKSVFGRLLSFVGGESTQNSFKKAQSIIFRSILFAELLYHLRRIKPWQIMQ